MSLISEYLKLIPKGIKHFSHVFQGIKNEVKLEIGNIPEEHAEVIAARRIICANCPYMSTNAVKLGIYETKRADEHCMQCGCNIKFKTADLTSNCGIEVYNATVKEESDKLNLKWEKI